MLQEERKFGFNIERVLKSEHKNTIQLVVDGVRQPCVMSITDEWRAGCKPFVITNSQDEVVTEGIITIYNTTTYSLRYTIGYNRVEDIESILNTTADIIDYT